MQNGCNDRQISASPIRLGGLHSLPGVVLRDYVLLENSMQFPMCFFSLEDEIPDVFPQIFPDIQHLATLDFPAESTLLSRFRQNSRQSQSQLSEQSISY